MNRLQFLAELKKSLLNTTKEVTFPLLSEQIEKADQIADQIVGIKWKKLTGITPASFQGIEERYINNSSVLIFSDGEHFKVYEKMCASCHSLVQWIAYEKKMKCFTCEKTFEVQLEKGDLTCKRYYIKEKNGEWFIGE